MSKSSLMHQATNSSLLCSQYEKDIAYVGDSPLLCCGTVLYQENLPSVWQINLKTQSLKTFKIYKPKSLV